MASKSRIDINTEVATLFPDNNTGLIDPADMRTLGLDLSDSHVNKTTDTHLLGGVVREWDATVQYYTGAWVIYDYKWYKANTNPAITGSFSASDWDFKGYVVYSGSTTIETAAVLTLNGTPVTLVAAIASKTIVPVSLQSKLTFNTVEYTVNGTLQVEIAGGGVVFTLTDFLLGAASKNKIAAVTNDITLVENAALRAKVATGNPSAGNSSITLNFSYTVQ
jgi:hypothetical protein